MPKEEYDPYIPAWVSGNGRIDEILFAQEFKASHGLHYVDGTFLTAEGAIPDLGRLRKEIYEEISPFVTSNASRKIDSILSTLALEARKEDFKLDERLIHLKNGTYDITAGFSPERKICRNRLDVSYDDSWPVPPLWERFVNELLEEEDVLTLQEFMGYCLVPMTKGQKMLMILGAGGEGKSRIGVVMQAILGANMNFGSLARLELSPFSAANLENKLLLVDDDLRMEALPQTNMIKTIVTADTPMELERKGIQSHQGRLYCRLMAFGNDSLRAMYDHSYGFYRRQLILQTKQRSPDRQDDPFLGERLAEEKDAIFHWALLGLFRLIGNNFRFTVSQHSRELMEKALEEGNNVRSFLRSQGYIRLDPEGMAPTRALYSRYREWCEDNAAAPLSVRSFCRCLEEIPGVSLKRSTHVPIGNGKEARGYRGIRLCSGF